MDKSLQIDQFKAGRWEQQYGYLSFLPEHIDHEWILSDPEVQGLLSEADF